MRRLPLVAMGVTMALGLLATVAQAEPVTLTASQMDELTAGAAVSVTLNVSTSSATNSSAESSGLGSASSSASASSSVDVSFEASDEDAAPTP